MCSRQEGLRLTAQVVVKLAQRTPAFNLYTAQRQGTAACCWRGTQCAQAEYMACVQHGWAQAAATVDGCQASLRALLDAGLTRSVMWSAMHNPTLGHWTTLVQGMYSQAGHHVLAGGVVADGIGVLVEATRGNGLQGGA